MIKRLSFYLYVFYCFEVGIFLLVAPWWFPQMWEQNYFFFLAPALKNVFISGYFRGAISGLGLLNIAMGIAEVIENERNKQLEASLPRQDSGGGF